ncbi:MAG: RNA polymerase sigma factor [Clostridia bacterium]|jgi:RNA polymerase sigma-70 factor (ECF subfamily)
MSIITQIKNGDEQAFAELIEQYKLPIYKTAKSILKDEDDVCDAIQDTALSIYKNIPNLKNEEYFKTWVIRITINKCYDILKKHKLNNEKMLKAQEDVSELHTNFDNNVILQTDLQTTLELLEEDLKIVTVLYYYNDLSISEISDILNIPKGTVKSRVFRAREKLYEILSKEEVDTIE